MLEHFSLQNIITKCVSVLAYIPACIIGLSLESYLILAFFIVVDTLTGITRSYVTSGSDSIRSSILTKGLLKKAHIILVPVILVLAGQGAGVDFLWVAKAILGGLIFSMGLSILGNIYSIYTGEPKPEWDGIRFVLNQTMNIIKTIITNIFQKR